ncbi:hypothetical protein B0H12DRAFT_648917 [Mycena haematopus]|nr:hypothetical protein B0H12DRAFT_648917 [Mycena haematopus]
MSWNPAGRRTGTVSMAHGSLCIKSIPLESLFCLLTSTLCPCCANYSSFPRLYTRESAFDLLNRLKSARNFLVAGGCAFLVPFPRFRVAHSRFLIRLACDQPDTLQLSAFAATACFRAL